LDLRKIHFIEPITNMKRVEERNLDAKQMRKEFVGKVKRHTSKKTLKGAVVCGIIEGCTS
jgi:hypothetical protein